MAAFIFLTASCGFRPLYSNTNTLAGGTSVLDQVWVDTIPDESGVILRNALIDRFYNNGTPDKPRYVLHVGLFETGRDLAIRKNDTTTRAQLVIRASYQLIDQTDNHVVEQNETRAVASYNVLSSQYTTLVTYSEARENALRELADKITLRVAAVLQK